MSNKTLALNEKLYDYLLSVSLREPEVLRRLREETLTLEGAAMLSAPEQGQFMALLVELTGARRCLEIGVYTGYSTLWLARALPAGGSLLACDIDTECTAIAQRYWAEAGVSERIELQLAPALQTLDARLAAGEACSYDLVFLDADKVNYPAYYERSLALLRPGGLLLIDNVLWSGDVADAAVQDADTRAIRKLNQRIHEDARVHMSLVPIADGVTLVRKC